MYGITVIYFGFDLLLNDWMIQISLRIVEM